MESLRNPDRREKSTINFLKLGFLSNPTFPTSFLAEVSTRLGGVLFPQEEYPPPLIVKEGNWLRFTLYMMPF